MRYIGIVIFFLSIPAIFSWLKGNRQHHRYAWFALGLLPFVIAGWHLDVSIISWAMWPGHTKGMQVSLLDSLALGLILVQRKPVWATPLKGYFIAYLLAAALSITVSNNPQASFFYAWQFARVLLVFLAVAGVCAEERGPATVIAGMVVGLSIQAGYVLFERASGAVQASGTMGHQNLLGMVTHFVLFPALALLLTGGRHRMALLGVIASAVVIIGGASRATIGFAGGGVIILMILSMARNFTGKKARIAGIGIVLFAIAAPLAYLSLAERFESKPLVGGNEEREAFERAANMIWADHPMGVGANEYVIVSNTEGYSARAGVIWNYGSRSANVHNTYLLVAAETGYFGLITFIALLFGPMIAAFRFAWANRRDPKGDIALGIGVNLAVVAAHCKYEWIFVIWNVQYMLAIGVGILSGQMLVRRAERQQARRPKDEQAAARTVREPELAMGKTVYSGSL
jgi:O-antigen ligase